MKITIESVENGYTVDEIDHDAEFVVQRYVYQELAEAIRHAVDYFDDTSRHSEKRVYVIEAPGDKHADFTEEHSNVIWGKS